MATAAARKTLRQAERIRYESMTIEELEALVATEPPDEEFDAALKRLSVAELDWFLDNPRATRQQVLTLAAGRTEAPDAIRHPR